jgi:hypothetical protein
MAQRESEAEPDPWARPPVVSRRRARQETERTYRIRVDVAGAKLIEVLRAARLDETVEMDDLTSASMTQRFT